MVLKNLSGKLGKDRLAALAVALLLAVLAAAKFDFFYDLNDDVLMKDILSGVYTGTPEGHNIQMHWPASALISLFYRAARGLPWYGLFLCFCHFGCFYLILSRCLGFFKTWYGKLASGAVAGLLFGSIFLEHLVFAQYTVTCTLLGGTAAFLFYTTEIGQSARGFIRKNIPGILLVWAAYLVRSEMLLLVLPMVCVAGAAKWGSEEKIFTRDHCIKYLGVFGLILAGLLLGQAVHEVAYSSQEWRAFTELFDNRTELYDFQAPPSYEEHREFYQQIGLTESEKILLDNYNFGMDEEIDGKVMGEIARYAGSVKSAKTPFFEKLALRFGEYRYRSFHGKGAVGSDYPWNYGVLLGYGAVFFLAIPRKYAKGRVQGAGVAFGLKNALGIGWKLAFLLVVRTLLWLYILMGDRAPERITHSLYLMEFCILAAMALAHWEKICSLWVRRISGGFVLGSFGLLALLALPDSIRTVSQRQEQREQVEECFQELYAYFGREENRGNFYLMDVYSSVAYQQVPRSEKMFAHVDNTLANYDIMGGWASKSPLQEKKLAQFGIDNMEKALREREDVYFVRQKSEDMQWLEEYYAGHGTPVETRLAAQAAGIFEIYEVFPAGRD